MDKDEHGTRLRTAMARESMGRQVVADTVGVAVRTVTNWITGKTMPSDRERAALRQMFPGYDDPGDPVAVAIMNSELTEDRQHTLIGTYKRLLREQAQGGEASTY